MYGNTLSNDTLVYWMGVFKKWVYTSGLMPPQQEQAIGAIEQIVARLEIMESQATDAQPPQADISANCGMSFTEGGSVN